MRPNINGVSSKPDRVGLAPLTTCKNSGTKISTPNIDRPTMNAAQLDTENTGLRNRYSGSHRLGSTAFVRQERHGEQQRGNGEPDDRRRPPLVLVATPHRDQQQARDRGDEQRGAEDSRSHEDVV